MKERDHGGQVLLNLQMNETHEERQRHRLFLVRCCCHVPNFFNLNSGFQKFRNQIVGRPGGKGAGSGGRGGGEGAKGSGGRGRGLEGEVRVGAVRVVAKQVGAIRWALFCPSTSC